MMTSLVACDSSFMIKSLCSFRIPGVDYDFSINTTHVAMLLVSLFILIVAIIARVKINKANASDTPGMFQNIIELVIEMLGSMVDGIMGRNANRFVNYITTLFIFIIISNISGLFGLRPPTADYGVTLALGLITFVLVQFNGIKKNHVGHFTALFQPIWFLFPINLIGEFAVPLSLSLRLFGNVIIDFGAFVDIGVHQDGLVHISQMSEKFIKHPLEAVSVGDVVEVRVLGVDEKKNRISLSMKGLNK